jgi:hypothetical protein
LHASLTNYSPRSARQDREIAAYWKSLREK